MRYYLARGAIVSLYRKARNLVVITFARFWIQTPWSKAILRTALAAYGDSELYRLRCEAMDSKFAFKSFFEYEELGFWKWVAKRDGWYSWPKIVFTPFSVCQSEVTAMFTLGF
jgi:hypothetical protein